MPFSQDASGQWQFSPDDSTWLGAPAASVAAPSILDDAMRKQQLTNLQDQATAVDNYTARNQGGLAMATAGAAPTPQTQPESQAPVTQVAPSGAVAGVAVPTNPADHLASVSQALQTAGIAGNTPAETQQIAQSRLDAAGGDVSKALEGVQNAAAGTRSALIVPVPGAGWAQAGVTAGLALTGVVPVPLAGITPQSIVRAGLQTAGAIVGSREGPVSAEGLGIPNPSLGPLGSPAALVGGALGGGLPGFAENAVRAPVAAAVNPEFKGFSTPELQARYRDANEAYYDLYYKNPADPYLAEMDKNIATLGAEIKARLPDSKFNYGPVNSAVSQDPMQGFEASLNNPDYVRARADAARSGNIADAQNTPAPAPPPTAPEPPTTGGAAAADIPPPAGAGFSNRSEVPFTEGNATPPNVPGLVDAEQFGVTQAWAARMPNIPAAEATPAQILTGLYNAGLETTVDGIRSDPSLQAAGIRTPADLYAMADRNGIRMPQEQPPSGMPDAMDYGMQRAPQRQEAAAGGMGVTPEGLAAAEKARGGAPMNEPSPPVNFNDFLAARRSPVPGTIAIDELGRPITVQAGRGAGYPGSPENPTGNGGGGNGGGNTPAAPANWRDPTAWEQAVAVAREPTNLLLTGSHVARTGVGTTIMHPTESVPLLANYARAWVDPEGASILYKDIQDRPMVAGSGQTVPANFSGTMVNLDPAEAGIRATDFKGPAGDHVRPAAIDRMVKAIPVVGNIISRSADAGIGYLNGLRDSVYNTEAMRALKAGDGIDAAGNIDKSYYKAMYDTISDNTGHGFKGGTPGEVSALGIGPSALVARFRSIADPFIQPGTINPLGTGARSIAIRNLMGIAGFVGVTDALGQLTGAHVYLPMGVGNVKATDLTNPYGVESKLFKVGTTSPSGYKTLYSGGSGYDSLFRIFANAAMDVRAGDKQALETHVNAYLKGQMGPVPERALELLLGPSGVNSQNPDVQSFAKNWKGDYVTTNSLKNEAKTEYFAKTYTPIALQSINDAVKGWGTEGVLRAAPSLLGGEVSTLPPSAAAAGRMKAANLTGPQYEDVQSTLHPYFSGADQITARGGTDTQVRAWQAQYASVHPEIRSALREGGYSVPGSVGVLKPQEYAPGQGSPLTPQQYTPGTAPSPLHPQEYQYTPKPTPTFTPRNKQPVAVGER